MKYLNIVNKSVCIFYSLSTSILIKFLSKSGIQCKESYQLSLSPLFGLLIYEFSTILSHILNFAIAFHTNPSLVVFVIIFTIILINFITFKIITVILNLRILNYCCSPIHDFKTTLWPLFFYDWSLLGN